MFHDIASYLPFIISVIWIPISMMKNRSSYSQRLLHAMTIIIAAYFYIDAQYVGAGTINFHKFVVLDCISQYITLLIFPISMVYLRSILNRRSNHPITAIAMIPALIQGVSATTIYLLMGFDNAAKYIEALISPEGLAPFQKEGIYVIYRLVCTYSYNTIIVVWMLIELLFLYQITQKNDYRAGDAFKFVFKGKVSSSINICAFSVLIMLLTCGVRISIGGIGLYNNQLLSEVLSLILAVCLFLLFYIGTFFKGKRISFADIFKPGKADSLGEDVFFNIPTEEEEVVNEIHEKEFTLKDRFVEYMEKNEAFTDPELNIEKVAEALSTNRTYISLLLKDELNMNFREYVNKLRIERVKYYLLHNSDRTLDEIAMEAGFISDSQLSKKFREIEGTTPRTWVKAQNEE